MRLHDLQRAFIRKQLSHAWQQELHHRLLNRYKSRGPSEDCGWWQCLAAGDPDAPFICSWLGYHLIEARGDDGRAEAAALLSEFSSA